MTSSETRSTDSEQFDQADPSAVDDRQAAEVSIDIAAGIDRVWEALVTDGGLEPWMGRGATIDAKPDGTLQVPDVVGGVPRRGLVHTVDNENELGFTWWPEHRPVERSNVSIRLIETETGTRVTVVEARLPSAAKAWASMAPAGAGTSPGSKAQASPAQLAGSLRGCWSWRLAVLSLASQMVRI